MVSLHKRVDGSGTETMNLVSDRDRDRDHDHDHDSTTTPPNTTDTDSCYEEHSIGTNLDLLLESYLPRSSMGCP